MSKGRYFLGRVVKINLDQNGLMDAIVNAPTITTGKFDWTITDTVDGRDSQVPFIFGRLSKYATDGETTVINLSSRAQQRALIPNLLETSAPFVYLPELSGIAFLHVWNGIPQEVFARRFRKIIEAAFDYFFVSCEIEPISDYRLFTSRLRKLDSFTEFSATVYPPNPLFGRLWASLHEYVKSRNASQVTVKEQSTKQHGLNSDIVELLTNIMIDPKYAPLNTVSIGDAALLMAADGYGKGRVKGFENGEEVIIKTSDSQESFEWEKDPIPHQLAAIAEMELRQVSINRDMDH
jgi:hypothetical protein